MTGIKREAAQDYCASFAHSSRAALDSPLDGLTFVIGCETVHFANRDALKQEIKARGGNVTGFIGRNADFLINNEKESSSSKNKRAKLLGIPIITEEEFLNMAGKRA